MLHSTRTATAALAGLLLAAGCSSPKPAMVATTTPTPVAATPVEPPMKKGVGIEMANLDKSVDPCTDFFQYANGNWIKNNPIPASEVRWGSFNELADRNNAILKRILENAAANTTAAAGSNEQKVGALYYTGMDTVTIDRLGIEPLRPELAKIEAIKRMADIQPVLEHHKKIGTGALFGGYVGQDDKNSEVYAVNIYQGGLGLPDRDMYLNDDARSKAARSGYVTMITNMLKLAGESEADAKKHADAVLRLETKLAKASKSRVELRDPYGNYNKMTVAELQKLAPNFQWQTMLNNLGMGQAKTVIVGQPAFLKEASTLLKTVGVPDWKTYLKWHLISSQASALSTPFVQESFDFYSKQLRGAKTQQPRWKRVLRETDGDLGEAFGQLYVDKAFTPAAKKRAQELVQNLRTAFTARIKQLDWMSPATKLEAQRKLDAFTVKIGYPDKWRDYSKLSIARDKSYVENVLAANEYAFNYNVSKLGQPVDRMEWGMTPPTVNAYYNPGMNEIVFPAGILQPPFFNPDADDAVNYGGIGAVIGHEITHGFDDQGRLYDAKGNLKSWWTPEDSAKFAQRTAMVDAQYSAYQPVDSVYVNGKLTMGENIADIGGIAIAYDALQQALKKNNPGKIDGLTPEQRFFLSFAQIWRVNARPEYLRQQVMTDPHSPAMFRVNGPLSLMPQFYQAFGCKDGDKMVRSTDQRAKIW